METAKRYAQSLSAFVHSAGWDRHDVEAFQSRCLRQLVRHAWERVPFYRDLYGRHGIQPEEIRGIEDLGRLPFALRDEMQDRPPEDLIARGVDPKRLFCHRTSGSTGAPFTVRRTWFEERFLHLVRLRENIRFGLRPRYMHVKVVRIKNIRQPRDYHRMIGLFRGRQVDCLLPVREVLDRLAEIQPDVLGGYAGSLAWIATEATEEDRRKIRPRYIVTGAETMTPDMRHQITDCFGVRIYDAYGAHEVNLLATECKETGLLHAAEVATLVEVLKDGKPAKPGEFGEVVVTALHSYAMPILRYRLRDLARAGPERCPCGAPFRTIESVQGRVMDRFPLRDGSTMHPYHIVTALNQESDWLRRYQIVQTSPDQVHIKIVPLRGKAPDDGAWDRIRARVEKAVGPLLHLGFELVEELPPGANGKFRPYYSMVNASRNANHSEAR